MKHAWLIMAHNEFEVLQQLVSLLDDGRSDFFLHYDAKLQKLPAISVEKGRLFILDNRVDVRWGSVSQIEAELALLEAAQAKGPYSHYHILSGTHLPLRSVDELLRFYDAHPEESVARFWPEDAADADFKLRRYHFPLGHYKFGKPWRRRLCQRTWQGVIKVQKVLGIRLLKNETFVKTDNWLSLSEAACRYLLAHRAEILNKYRWSFCGDEYFAVSELQRNGSAYPVFDCQQLLYVEFQKDTPRSFPLSERVALMEKGYLWARKFTA